MQPRPAGRMSASTRKWSITTQNRLRCMSYATPFWAYGAATISRSLAIPWIANGCTESVQQVAEPSLEELIEVQVKATRLK